MARRDDDVISKLAGQLRAHLNLKNTIYIDIPTVFWKFRKFRTDFNFSIIPDAELPDAEATWDSYKRRLSIRQSLYYDINRHIPHARMVAAEEIAHAYLDHHGIRNHSVQAKAYEKIHTRTRNEEREARIFAANFLAPHELIQSNFTIDDISFKFGLSYQAAHIRYEEHQRWQSLINNKPRDLPEKVSDFLKEAKLRGYQIKSI